MTVQKRKYNLVDSSVIDSMIKTGVYGTSQKSSLQVGLLPDH